MFIFVIQWSIFALFFWRTGFCTVGVVGHLYWNSLLPVQNQPVTRVFVAFATLPKNIYRSWRYPIYQQTFERTTNPGQGRSWIMYSQKLGHYVKFSICKFILRIYFLIYFFVTIYMCVYLFLLIASYLNKLCIRPWEIVQVCFGQYCISR